MIQTSPQRLYNTWGPIMGVMVIMLALCGLYLYHQQQFSQDAEVFQQLNRANNDFSRGFLHLALAEAPESSESPWQLSIGIAFLDEAFQHYESVLKDHESQFHSSFASELQGSQLADFDDQAQQVRKLLEQDLSLPANAQQLRLSTYTLLQQAQALEVHIRSQLEQTLHYQEQTFLGALLVGLLLLAAFFWANWWTERRREESESRFRQLTETINEVFWLIDAQQYTLLYVSPAYERIWGRSCQMLLKDPAQWLESIHPQDRARIEAAQAQLARGTYRQTFRIIRPDGSLRWIEDRAFPVLDEDGNVYRVAGLATDITDFKQIETRLQQQESLLKQASRLARFGAWKVDVATQLIYLSEEVSRILEWPSGKPFPLKEGVKMYPPKWRPLVQKAVQACIDTGEDYQLEVQVETASERLRWVHIQGRAVRDHSQQVIYLEGSFQDITEQKNIATLFSQGGGHRFQQLADALPFVIWSAQPDGVIDYANQMFQQYTEVTQGENISLGPWLDLIHPEDRELVSHRWHQAIAKGEEYLAEFRMRQPGSDYRWHLARAMPVLDSEGQILRWYGTDMDIHDRKQIEEQAQHLVERLAITLESITDAFFTLDADWRFTYVNHEAERVLKCERTQLIGASIWEAFPEANGSDFEHNYRLAVKQQHKTSFEAWFEPLQAWLSVNAYPSSEGLAVYFQDVTLRHQEQEQMRLLQTCIDHMNDIVLITEAEPKDEPGPRILYANPAFERITGYTLEEVKGRSPRLLQGPKTQRHELDRVREAMSRWEPVRAELINYTKAGEEYWLEMELVPLANDSGWYTHWVAVERNITERKRIAELEQSQKVAELANEAKSHFLASMSHEIRTPINGVIGMVDVLHQTSLKGYQVEMVDVIRDSATSLLTLIEDILDFSKIEAGRLELESQPLSLEVLLRKSCLLLDRMAETHGVDLFLYVDPNLPSCVLGDELRLRQIMLNLINNAIKFSGNRDIQGEVSIRVHLLEAAADQVRVEFRIRDNGIGMDEATQARLFSPFMQADASTTRHYGGTGLGLSITHNLVTMMGGTIRVSSQLGGGSEFRIQLTLPLGAMDELTGDSAPDITATACVLVGNSPLMHDLHTYLEAAGAQVQWFDPQAPTTPSLPPTAEPWVWVVDTGDHEALPPVMNERWPARQYPQLQWLLLTRGHRHHPRKEDNRVQVDLNSMDRTSFIRAVAIAAGQLSAIHTEQERSELNKHTPPSRQQALEQGMLILVAEDNVTNQNVIRRQLGMLGYAADIASDGEKALDLWQQDHYALLLTDLHMPRMDGYELTQHIRAREAELKRPPKPIIALTANADPAETDRCLRQGMNGYLTKPAALSVLGATLATWLEPINSPSSALESTTPEGPLQTLDLRVLIELVGKDAGILREFLQDFKVDAKRLTTDIQQAASEQDWQKVALLAHTLKSSSRAVGGGILGAHSAQLERRIKNKDTAKINPLLAQLEQEASHLLAEIDRYLGLP